MCSGDGCLQWAIKSLLFIWRFSRVLSYSIPTSRNWWDLERTITRSDDGKNLELSFCCRFSQWNWQINAELCREDAYTRNSVDCGTNFPDISTVAFSASFMLNFLFFFILSWQCWSHCQYKIPYKIPVSFPVAIKWFSTLSDWLDGGWTLEFN